MIVRRYQVLFHIRPREWSFSPIPSAMTRPDKPEHFYRWSVSVGPLEIRKINMADVRWVVPAAKEGEYPCPVCERPISPSVYTSLGGKERAIVHLRVAVEHLCQAIECSSHIEPPPGDPGNHDAHRHVRIRAQRACAWAEKLKKDLEDGIIECGPGDYGFGDPQDVDGA
jgi:hypothetical protein